MKIKTMMCDLCNLELHPLDAHTGYDKKGNLMTTHIFCWNQYYKDEIKKEKEDSK